MNPQCFICKVALIEGYMLDKGESNRRYVSTWVEGPPEDSFWMGTKIGERRRSSVAAYLCPQCGRIELYASPGSESV